MFIIVVNQLKKVKRMICTVAKLYTERLFWIISLSFCQVWVVFYGLQK